MVSICLAFSNKILTSSRNGDLVMWDLNKSGPDSKSVGFRFTIPRLYISHTTLERRAKDHIRSIHKLSISSVVQYYCVTGGADGDVRVWVRFGFLPPVS